MPPAIPRLRPSWGGLVVLVCLICAVLIAASGMAMPFRPWKGKPPAPAQSARGPAGDAARGGKLSERIEIESLTFGGAGFEPAQITRPPGRFRLALNSLIRERDMVFRLESEAGGRVHEFRRAAKKRKWSETVELPPGRYRLTEAGQPQSFCLITITRGYN